jgi:hypothetical protein
VDCRLLSGRPAAVDALIASETVIVTDHAGLVCVIGHLVLGQQASRPWIRILFERQPGDVLFRRVLVPAGVT